MNNKNFTKKLFCIFFIILSFLSFANESSFKDEILNLEQEFKVLVEKENARFKQEEANMMASKKRVENLYSVKEKIEANLTNKTAERENRFFKDDYDDLIEKYETYLTRINREIAEQEKMIADFEVIKAMRGE